MKNPKDKKFIEYFDLANWEVETDSGWQDIKTIGKTIRYEVWELRTDNFFLECADEHIVFDGELNEIYVRDLKVDDLIMTINGKEEIIDIKNTGVYKNMYDLEVDHKNHRYFTSGILSHNSLWVGNIAAQAVKNGHNVAVITLEMDERKYMKRLGSNILGLPVSTYKDSAEDLGMMKKRLSDITFSELKKPGKLIVKEFPTSQASVIDIERYLLKTEEQLGIKFKIVVVDYINIMKNWRNPNTENTYIKIKQIAEDLRGSAMSNEWAILSATQTKQCLTLDTLVECKNKGKIRIDQIKIGDDILCENGWTTVLHKTNPIKRKIYEIITESGKKIRCSANHKFPICNGKEVLCSDLKIGDLLFSRNI